jgi:mannosyl-glycoprotein endo-beta-N-acetylglucosaminidase
MAEARILDPVWFDTAQQILQWQASQANPLTIATVPLAPRMAAGAVRMLVGLDNGPWTFWPEFDANPQGGPRGNVYNFPYWQYVDVMYYYVHRLAAVPPTVWINAAHRNGVKMCAAVTADCAGCPGEVDKLFVDPAAAAKQLFLIASTYGFDGWMIDIENGADPSANVRQTMTLLRGMVLPNGQPCEAGYYQAGVYEVDDRSYPFFRAGTFFQSDYTSGPGHPARSYNYLQRQGQVDARFATYWAVYVYSYEDSRGSLCNGSACLDMSGFIGQLAQARMTGPTAGYYQSLGVYAPGWTMYGGQNSTSAPLPPRDQFHATDRLFWVGANPRIAPDGTLQTSTRALSNYIPARTSIIAKPFVTRFNTGEGSSFWLAGQRAVNREWNHLSSQDRLPTWLVPINQPAPAVTADYAYSDAYDGGSSLACQGPIAPGQRVEYALYQTKINLQTSTTVTFRYLLRNAQSPLPYLKLNFSDGTSATVPATRGGGWLIAAQNIAPRAATLDSIFLGVVNESPTAATVDVLIGELRVIDASPVQPPGILTPTRVGDLLSWSPPSGPWTIWYYNLFAVTGSVASLVGRTVVPGYDLSAPLFPATGTYRIQPVTTTGDATAVLSE